MSGRLNAQLFRNTNSLKLVGIVPLKKKQHEVRICQRHLIYYYEGCVA